MTEQTELDQVSTSVGQQLHKVRQQKQLSVPNIAQKLCLKEHIIYALENDETLSNVAPTFVKGYIRAYAKILGLDGESLVEQYNAAHSEDSRYNAPMISFSRKVARESIDSRWMLVTYGVVAILILMVIIWWYQQTQTNSLVVTSSHPIVQEPSSGLEPSAHLKPLDEPESKENPVSFTSETVSESEPAALVPVPLPNKQQEQSAPDISQVITALENADPDVDGPLLANVNLETETSDETTSIELVFTFAEDCWIKVTDATGNDIAYGVKDAGRIMPVSGMPPFSVVLGAPAGVSISYAGTPVDLSGFPYNRTARFNLPLEAQ